ncbi:MAG: hypothetical protein K5928_00775 [Prevotella sp.]|nr:hypothetical protein [Prevotella sp.]
MGKLLTSLLAAALTATTAVAQTQETTPGAGSQPSEWKRFWTENWFVQFGLDMSLQKPYGYDFADVFPNGKTFGVDVAVGKWFTPVLGIRGRLNWENGIRLFENDQANWLAPFYEPGVNMDRGGYMAFFGDIMFSVHGLFCDYDRDRLWTLALYPRAGAEWNFGSRKGSPLLGLGLTNTFRIGQRWSLYVDAAYNMVASGHVGRESGASTGTNYHSNGYFDLNVGAQLDLGQRGFKAAGHDGGWQKSGWFVQFGVDMTMQNPYGSNFMNTFPKGTTFGIDVAGGKWFTPELALRLKASWDNGLLKNTGVEWVPPLGPGNKNYEGGGFVVLCGDVMLQLNNLFAGLNDERRWEINVYPRAGIVSNRATNSGSPIVGLGVENTYRLNHRWSLYADLDYQFTTSEGAAGATGMDVHTGSNGFLDLNIGARLDL